MTLQTRRIVDEFIRCADVLSTNERQVKRLGEDIREEFLREGEHRALAVVNVPVAIARECFEEREMPLGTLRTRRMTATRQAEELGFVELAFAAKGKMGFCSRRWHGRFRTVEDTSVERANGREKDPGIVKGDVRGAPASDFEGKIDARKKKETYIHTRRRHKAESIEG